MQVVIFGATEIMGYEVLLHGTERDKITKIITIRRNKININIRKWKKLFMMNLRL